MDRTFNTYLHSPLTISGPCITQLGVMEVKDNGDMVMEAVVTDVPHNHTPVLVNNGIVTCQGPTGTISTLTLKTHDAIVVRGVENGCRAVVAHPCSATWEEGTGTVFVMCVCGRVTTRR